LIEFTPSGLNKQRWVAWLQGRERQQKPGHNEYIHDQEGDSRTLRALESGAGNSLHG